MTGRSEKAKDGRNAPAFLPLCHLVGDYAARTFEMLLAGSLAEDDRPAPVGFPRLGEPAPQQLLPDEVRQIWTNRSASG